MSSTDSPNPKPPTSAPPLILTPSEIASLRQDLQQASAWALAEIQKQKNTATS